MLKWKVPSCSCVCLFLAICASTSCTVHSQDPTDSFLPPAFGDLADAGEVFLDEGTEELEAGDDLGSDAAWLDPSQPERSEHVVVLPVTLAGEAWTDLAFLSAVAATSKANGNRPAVLGLQRSLAPPRPVLDFLARLAPKHIYSVNGILTGLDGAVRDLRVEGAVDFSVEMATLFWTRSSTVVWVANDRYEEAILASSLAARIGAPLIFFDPETPRDFEPMLNQLVVQRSIVVGQEGRGPGASSGAWTYVPTADDVLEWMSQEGLSTDYIALTNAADRTSGQSQKLSLLAPILAARRGGIALPFTLGVPAPPVEEGEENAAHEFLKARYALLGGHPSYLALVGHFDAVPVYRKASIFDNPIEEHPVSDLPYAEVDDDPFVDIALGRVIATNLQEGSLVATRIANYELLVDGVWDRQFVETGLWGFDELRATMLNVGFGSPDHPTQSEIEAMESLEVSAILHKDHSYCSVLGHAFDTSTPTLLAPAVVSSMGCSVGAIDLVLEGDVSIVGHLLHQGAVAFLGASRNAIAENTLIDVSFWNYVLDRQRIGTAFRGAVNDMIVHWLDEEGSAGVRYAIDIAILYGDPAMPFVVPTSHQTRPAMAERTGNTVVVRPPELWTRVQFVPEQLAEWNFTEDLFMYTGPGAAPRTYWSGSHDNEDLYYAVNLDLPEGLETVRQEVDFAEPLGWSGQAYQDHHQDGTRSLRWRVRLLDYDMSTGEILSAVDEATYRLEP
jgi:hypothetical protein